MSPDPLFARFGREFPPGEVLFREGEPGSVMYVIREGRVKITRSFSAGERTLATLGVGEFFGEMAILNQKPRAATATALEPLRALEFDARTVEAMVQSNGEIAVRLMTKLAKRLDQANALIELLLQQDPRVRVVLGLARVADEQGERCDDGVRVPVDPEAFGRELGVDAATVHEVLRRLARVRIARSVGANCWLVPDPQQLHTFAELLEDREREASIRPSAPAPGEA